jgi:hypothetical protein
MPKLFRTKRKASGQQLGPQQQQQQQPHQHVQQQQQQQQQQSTWGRPAAASATGMGFSSWQQPAQQQNDPLAQVLQQPQQHRFSRAGQQQASGILGRQHAQQGSHMGKGSKLGLADEEATLEDATCSGGWPDSQQRPGLALQHQQQQQQQHQSQQSHAQGRMQYNLPDQEHHQQQRLQLERQLNQCAGFDAAAACGARFTTATGAAAATTAAPAGGTASNSSTARAKWQAPIGSSSMNSSTHSRWASRQPLQVLPNNSQQQQQHLAPAPGVAIDHAPAAGAVGVAAPSKASNTEQAAGFKRPGGFNVPRPAAGSATDSKQQQHGTAPGPAGPDKAWQQPGTQQQQQGFVFPPAGSRLPLRYVGIATSFNTAADYKAAMLAAMTEEVRV